MKKLHGGAAAKVVAPIWIRKVWHHALIEMASEELIVAPPPNLL
jgi:hypothetical protein